MARRSMGLMKVEELRFTAPVTIEKRTGYYRSDHLREVRKLALDLAMDDYDFSQAEIVRAALAAFLRLDLVQQVRALEAYRREEVALGVGIGSVRGALASVARG